jgi:putative ABC transport system permease protein
MCIAKFKSFSLELLCPNLSTARSANRAREVGIRKVLGSLRKNLIAQFLTESVLICFPAFIMALCLACLLVPVFNQLSQKHTGISMPNYSLIVK